MVSTVDPKVYDLASEWLSDEGNPDQAQVMALAIRIQTVIEEYEAEQMAAGDPRR